MACAAAIFFGVMLAFGAIETAEAQSAAPEGAQASAHVAHPQTEGTTQQNAAADKDAAPNAAAIAAPQKPAATARKVITNDDIDARHARESEEGGKKGLIYGTGLCDDECAENAREAMGFGREREGEWQIRLMSARRNLQADMDWRRAYKSLGEEIKTYCTFQYQQEVAILPTSNTWDAGVERAKRQQYAENMRRILVQKIEGANLQLARMAETVQPIEPVRATIMNVLMSRANATSCMGEDP